jgi:hypothetical protein
MKVLPKSINFSKTAPTSVEEMKDGEMRITEDGVYARVGHQVLLGSWDVHYLPTTSTTTTTTTT